MSKLSGESTTLSSSGNVFSLNISVGLGSSFYGTSGSSGDNSRQAVWSAPMVSWAVNMIVILVESDKPITFAHLSSQVRRCDDITRESITTTHNFLQQRRN